MTPPGSTVVWIADWADDTVQVSAQHARLGKDAVLRHVAVTLGGDVVRMAATVRFDAPGGDAELLGLYFADDGQHFESRLLVDHAQPNCKSDVLYKGALQGDPDSTRPDAHTVWVGDVLIRAEASGTDTFEVNRNLVLTDGARADSVPNLEIETGEILGAGHASATGRFDDEQLFYLRARGIPEEQARRLVVRGFFGEIIAKIAVPSLRERLTDAIEHELAITESRTQHDHSGNQGPARQRRQPQRGRRRHRHRDPQGRQPDGEVGGDPCGDGAQRIRQVHAVLRDRRTPQVPRHLRLDHPRRRRTCWR